MFQQKRVKKTIKVKHTEPYDFHLNYILLPVGYRYNTDIAHAKRGDRLRFFNGGLHSILTVRRLKLSSVNTDILCRMRYGITLKAALSRWQMNAKMEGHGMSAVSEEECLWVIYCDDEDDTV